MTEHGGRDALGVVLHGAQDRPTLREDGFTWRVLVRTSWPRARATAPPTPVAATAARRPAQRPHQLPHAGRLRVRDEDAGGAEPEPGPADHAPEQDLGRQGRARDRDHRERHRQRRQAGVREHRRAPRARVAGGRARDGVGLRADQRLQERRRARDERSSATAATSSCRSSTRTGSRARATRPARPPAAQDEAVDDTAYIAARARASTGARTAASATPRPRSCPISAGLAENGVDPNRNYGQFWGGPGADTNPRDPDLPRPRRRSPSPRRATSSGSSRATR